MYFLHLSGHFVVFFILLFHNKFWCSIFRLEVIFTNLVYYLKHLRLCTYVYTRFEIEAY